MTVHQLSIFVENRQGTLIKVLQLLKEAGVQLIASTIADTVEYGIYRIICGEPERAYSILKEKGISVALSDVFAIELDDEVGRAADTLTLFSEEGISIAYMYSFLLKGKGILVFRTDDEEKTCKVIKENGMNFISEKDLSKY